MQCALITDKLLEALKSGEYKFLRMNFPNGDMVGHTGSFDAAVIGVESVDLCLARMLPVVDRLNGVAIITADHGNAEEMYETKKGIISIDRKTGNGAQNQYTNKVPFIIYDNRRQGLYTEISLIECGGYGCQSFRICTPKPGKKV